MSSVRELAIEGLKAYDQGRYDEAADKLGRAYEVMRVPTVGLARARALVELGKLVEASELYLEVTRLELAPGQPATQERAKAEAAQERKSLMPRIPQLVLRTRAADGSGVTVRVDGVVVPPALLDTKRLVNPGRHSVVAQRGAETKSEEVVLGEGETTTIAIAFEATPPKPTFEPPATRPATSAPTASPPKPSETGEGPRSAHSAGGDGCRRCGPGTRRRDRAMGRGSRASSTEEGCPNGDCPPGVARGCRILQCAAPHVDAGVLGGRVVLVGGGVLLLTSPSRIRRRGARVGVSWAPATPASWVHSRLRGASPPTA